MLVTVLRVKVESKVWDFFSFQLRELAPASMRNQRRDNALLHATCRVSSFICFPLSSALSSTLRCALQWLSVSRCKLQNPCGEQLELNSPRAHAQDKCLDLGWTKAARCVIAAKVIHAGLGAVRARSASWRHWCSCCHWCWFMVEFIVAFVVSPFALAVLPFMAGVGTINRGSDVNHAAKADGFRGRRAA